jgi:hypothetical protein
VYSATLFVWMPRYSEIVAIGAARRRAGGFDQNGAARRRTGIAPGGAVRTNDELEAAALVRAGRFGLPLGSAD